MKTTVFKFTNILLRKETNIRLVGKLFDYFFFMSEKEEKLLFAVSK